MKKTIILSLLSFTTLAGHADEGMWMLTDLKEQNAATMYDMGLDIGIDKVYCPDSISLKDAVVHFGGGCTGEVISAEGLVLTNHHCGYGYPATQFGGARLPDRRILGDDPQGGIALRGADRYFYRQNSGYHSLCKRTIG